MTIFANIILPFAPRIRLNVTLRWRIGLIFPSLLPISNKYNIHIAIIRLLVNYIFVTIAEVEVNFSLDKMYNIFFINLAVKEEFLEIAHPLEGLTHLVSGIVLLNLWCKKNILKISICM